MNFIFPLIILINFIMDKNFYDIVIFGSGLSAKAMSLVARSAGLSFKVVADKSLSNKTNNDTRSLALSASSRKMLHVLGADVKTKPVKKW